MFIDTHCHLNFKAFVGGAQKVLARAQAQDVGAIIIPGTDIATSQTALDIAIQNVSTYALVGIHPHYALQYSGIDDEKMKSDLQQIATWLREGKVVGVGEVGLDRHSHTKSQCGPLIVIDDNTFTIQEWLFIHQVKLAASFHKSLSVHNREAVGDLLNIFETDLKNEAQELAGKVVLHCCEPDLTLLTFAQKHHFFIGVDGDITFSQQKQDFIRKVPIEMLVLETDSPYLLPEPLRSQKKYPNEPANISLIAYAVASLKEVSVDEVAKITSQNARSLFVLPE